MSVATNLNVELARARAQVEAIEHQIAEEERQSKEGQHRAMVDRCREAKRQLEELRSEANRLQGVSIHLQGEFENARRHVADWREQKPRSADYPTAEEIEVWRAELIRRQEAAAAAGRESRDAWQQYHVTRAEWLKRKEEFQTLADQESQLRSTLHPQRRTPITLEVLDGTPGTLIQRHA